MLGDRINRIEKFLNVKKTKNMNPVEWLERLYELECEWEEEHQEAFPV